MRLREIITIYIAIGAPLATACFLRRRTSATLLPTLLVSAAVAALWPIAALWLALARRRPGVPANQPSTQAAPVSVRSADDWLREKVGLARDGLLAALRRLEELAAETLNIESEKLKQATREARACAERYVALALAVAEFAADAPPSAQELELYRAAGRTGDDLLLAGHCLHRRNGARLAEHRARARAELLHALAETREAARGEPGGAAGLVPHANVLAARRLSEAALRAYAQAVELFSLLDDTRGVLSAARLLDAECGRLRRLAASLQLTHRPAHGGASCEPSTLLSPTSSPLNLTPRPTQAG